MVVDDSVTIRVALKRLFSSPKYDVVEAQDGRRALELLDESIDLMILDVNMPGLDGYGVCEKIRELGPAYAELPIVFLTSLETRAMELLGDEYGAYLSKPIDEKELTETVEQLLKSKTSVTV